MVKQAWTSLSPWKRAAVCVVLAASLAYFGVGVLRASHDGTDALPALLERVAVLAAGGEFYPGSGDAGGSSADEIVVRSSPLVATLLLPLVRLGSPGAIVSLGIVLQIGLYLVTLGLLGGVLARRGGAPFLLAWTLVGLNFVPFQQALTGLQPETVVLLLCALALVLETRGRSVASGVLLGVATMLAIYPVFLLGWFLVRRSSGGLAGAAGAMLGLGLLGAWGIGESQNEVYWLIILPTLFQELPRIDPANIALARPLIEPLGFDPQVAKRVGQAASLIVLSAGYLALYRRGVGRSRELDPELSFGLFVGSLVLFMPNVGPHDLLLLLVPFALVLARAIQMRERFPVWAGALLLVVFVSTTFPDGAVRADWTQALRTLAVPTLMTSWFAVARPLKGSASGHRTQPEA